VDISVTITRPNFENPPLVERAITVIFDRIDGFSLADFGRFGEHIKDEFPVVAAQPMREPVVENFDTHLDPPISFRLMPHDTLPRGIYRSSLGHEQIQLQPDIFAFNWLKVADAPYPRSEPLFERFKELFARFCGYAKDLNSGGLGITQCELININVIPVSDFHDVSFLKGLEFESPLPSVELESLQLQTHYLMETGDGLHGRLHLTLNPVLSIEDGAKAIRFELVARGAPSGPTLDEAMIFFDRARDAINAAFMATTAVAAHRRWGLR
jgi:uncharacterized protein (TIGR04255 family)